MDVGISTEVKLRQPQKADRHIFVTDEGMVNVPPFPPGKVCKNRMSFVYRTPFEETKFLFPASTMISVREVQSLKADVPIVETDDGIVTEGNPLHPWKAYVGMDVTEFGITTDIRLLQLLKALCPMVFTELGSVADVKLWQPSKADSPIVVTEFGIITDAKLLQ